MTGISHFARVLCVFAVLVSGGAVSAADDLPDAHFTVRGAEEGPPPAPDMEPALGLQTTNSHVTLSWTAEGPDPFAFEVERARDPGFDDAVQWYRGSDQASFVAGLAEGDYFFRVRTVDEAGNSGSWSPLLHVTVQYHSMRLALILFTIGAVVFLATLGLVVAGSRKAARENEEAGRKEAG